MGFFFKRPRAANSAVCGRIVPNFELTRDYIVDLVTCKNEEDSIKIEGARVLRSLSFDFSNGQGQLTLQFVVESYRITNSSEILQLSPLPARMKKI